MTPDEINIAIAEIHVNSLNLTAFQNPPGTVGYKCDLSGLWILADETGRTFGYNHKSPAECVAALINEYARKNYHGDLNAMHEAKLTLSEDKLGEMLDFLCEIVRRDHNREDGPMTAIIQATRAESNQEAEAFLRVHNLWRK